MSGESADADRTLAGLPEAEQVRTVEAWIAAGDAARVAVVAAGTLAHKSARKAARKGVHVLKARGVEVQEPVRAAPAILSAPREEAGSGFLTPVDPVGTQILVFGYPAGGGGLNAVQAIVQRDKGLLAGDGLQLSRKKLRAVIEGMEEQGTKFFPAPADYVRHRVSSHVARTRELGGPISPGIAALEAVLPRMPETPPPHPLEDALPRSERAQGRVTEAELEVLAEVALLNAWGPDEAVVHELLNRMNASAGGGLLVVSETQRRDAAEDALVKTIDETFGPRPAWVLDLLDTALCLLGAGSRQPAELLARSADELADPAREPRDIAFVRWLYRHLLADHARHHDHGPGGEPPESEEEPKKTRGGIYLP